MSRIGMMPIELPKGVNVDIKGSDITVTGSKGHLTQSFRPEMSIKVEDGVLTVERPSDSRQDRAFHGLTRALLNNMVVGVSEGFTRRLEIEGVGYRAELSGNNLVLNVGYSHPVEIEPPQNVQFEVENRGKLVIVTGIDKQVVGEISAKIRKVRPPEPYKGKGIRYEGEYVRRKAGKAGKV
ncbi:MAG: 50S ribosomal protein L6 [Anaerolineae bacterium SG8_19]|jgi:large subunit ribosomal protein L6|nr:MAG: 50S ribosomal protein L6 [Anaerolineae bacterium SG8_19]